jgi:drug/metabolite transporter (DMT)-like permease
MVSAGLVASFVDTVIGSSDSSLGKYATARIGTYKYTIFVIGIGLLPMIIYFALFGNIGVISLEVIALSVVASVFFGLGFILYYDALKTEQITHAAALGEVQPVILLLFGVVILGEVITLLEAAGALIIFAGAFLVITTDRMKVNWRLLPVVLANVCWSLYWIFLTYAISAYGGEGFPLLLARACAFLLILGFALWTNKVAKGLKKPASAYHKSILWLFVIISGLVDGAYNLIFGFIVNVHIIAIAASLFAAGPMITLVLGRIFFGDKLDERQKMGFILAIVGAMIIAL